MKKTLFTFLITCSIFNHLTAWEWWWKKPKTLEEKQLELQRKQIDDPTNPYINYNMGVAAYKKKSFDVAAANFDRALQHMPDKPAFKKQTHFNLGQAEYQQALQVVGRNWQKDKLSDEVYEKALALTQRSIKEFEAVLVLDPHDEKATKMKEEVERFQQKLLAKKYENKDKKDQSSPQDNKEQQKQQQQGAGSGNDNSDQGGNGQQGSQSSSEKEKNGDSKKNGEKQGADQQGQQGNNQEQKKSSANQSKERNGESAGQEGQKEAGSNERSSQQQPGAREQGSGQDQQNEQGKQPSGEHEQRPDQGNGEKKEGAEEQPQEKNNQGDGHARGATQEQEAQEVNGGEAVPGSDIMDHALDAHAKSVLEAVEQAEGNAQKRAMAYELMKMGRGNSKGNQKPW